jgi:hypothetical protein
MTTVRLTFRQPLPRRSKESNRFCRSYNEPMTRAVVAALLVLCTALPLLGQTPQPFPGVRPSQPEPQSKPAPAPSAPAATQNPQPAPVPASSVVGFPIYANAQFLASYDAGKQQRYYLFGTVAPYAEVVKYYQGVLKDRGAQVFAEPPTHMFSQRFREETMAFPPGVTVKDYAFGGSPGYLNPKPGAQPARFPTVIQIVPPPPATTPAK